MITSAQKKALKDAGYSIKGDTVLNKSGKTVGGYNKNGNIFAGSSTVRDILKSKPEEKKASAPKKPAAKKAQTKPKQRQMGRGDGASEVARRYSDANSSTPSIKVDKERSVAGNNEGPKEPVRRAEDKTARSARRPTGSNVPFVGTSPTRDEWNKMSMMERIRWGSVLPPPVKKDSPGVENKGSTRGRKALRDSRGYAKGGMVKANCGASMKPARGKK